MSLGQYLDAVEVAKVLGISVSAVHGLRSRGTLPSEWLAGKRVWTRETVDRYLKDERAQKRRRPPGQLTLGGTEMSTAEAIRLATQLKGIRKR